jgi:hypothetical protein
MGAVFERSTHLSSITDPDWTGSGDTLGWRSELLSALTKQSFPFGA